MTEDKSIEATVAELYFHYACRALLGGGKGQYVMEGLRKENPELCEKIMKVAREYLEEVEARRMEDAKKWDGGMLRLAKDLGEERSN